MLQVLERTFKCYITEDPAAVRLKEKLNDAEAKLAQGRNTMQLGYTDPATGTLLGVLQLNTCAWLGVHGFSGRTVCACWYVCVCVGWGRGGRGGWGEQVVVCVGGGGGGVGGTYVSGCTAGSDITPASSHPGLQQLRAGNCSLLFSITPLQSFLYNFVSTLTMNMLVYLLYATAGSFKSASSVQLRNLMRVAEQEETRKSAYEGLRSVGPFVAESFLGIVKDRNKLARLLGYEDFYDYKVQPPTGAQVEHSGCCRWCAAAKKMHLLRSPLLTSQADSAEPHIVGLLRSRMHSWQCHAPMCLPNDLP